MHWAATNDVKGTGVIFNIPVPFNSAPSDLATRTNERGFTWNYFYDLVGRRVEEVRPDDDTNPANNTATVMTPVNPSSDVSVSLVPSTSTVLVGQDLAYTINVVNFGSSDATGVVLSDALPANVTFVSATSSQPGVILMTSRPLSWSTESSMVMLRAAELALPPDQLSSSFTA